ncbi:hypothetical protein BV20DRAFT_971491 [Pilatotrama ljubarskyi]|nr:hypothetical protein BV20DRAFT_971491 [Pilatotrama ljubarskyi]
MILPDDTPESPTKSPAGPPSEAADEEYLPPPPAYPGRNSSQPADLEAQASSSRTPLVQPGHHIEAVEHAPTRFLKALGIAVLIWIAVGSFARSAYAGSHWRSHASPGGGKGGGHDEVDRPHKPHKPDTPDSFPGEIIFPKPTEGAARCVRASAPFEARNAHAETAISIQLPLSADVLYIFSRGALSRGVISFTTTEDRSLPQDRVSVDMAFSYTSNWALEKTEVCLFKRAPGEKGVGILTPETALSKSSLKTLINVRFPVRQDGELLRVKAFETNLPQFMHALTSLENKVHFGSISLLSRNMPIQADYLDAEEVSLTTTNARLAGNFRASQMLRLETSNSPISADVTLDHDDSRPHSTNLTMLTSNAIIDSRLTLRSTSPKSTGGLYDVVARTENSGVFLSVASQPIRSTLLLEARTKNAPASVYLPVEYEGAFSAATTSTHAEVECDEDAYDPTGRGRRRTCAVQYATPQVVRGWTAWEVEGGRHGSGDVRVVSTNVPVKLVL